MNQSRFVRPLVFIGVCLLASSLAAGEGFKLPNLNPFGGKKSASASIGDSEGQTTIPAAGEVVDEDAPKALKTTKSTKSAKTTPAEPTTWQKFNYGTQNFFAKSKTTLMPWTKKKLPPPQATGTTKVYQGSAMTPKPAKKKSIYSSLFGESEKESRGPDTVDEFIGQPRVPF